MSDLVKRLRDRGQWRCDNDLTEAAERIEQLERDLAEAQERADHWIAMAAQTEDGGDEALAELAAEKALADRLYESLNRVDGDYFEAVAAYRKARGL